MPQSGDRYVSPQEAALVAMYGSGDWPFAGYAASPTLAAYAALAMYSLYSQQLGREIGGTIFYDAAVGAYGFTIGLVGPQPQPGGAQVDMAGLLGAYNSSTRVFVGAWHTHVYPPGSKMAAEAAGNPANSGFSVDDAGAFQIAAAEFARQAKINGSQGPAAFVFAVSTPEGYVGTEHLALDSRGNPIVRNGVSYVATTAVYHYQPNTKYQPSGPISAWHPTNIWPPVFSEWLERTMVLDGSPEMQPSGDDSP